VEKRGAIFVWQGNTFAKPSYLDRYANSRSITIWAKSRPDPTLYNSV